MDKSDRQPLIDILSTIFPRHNRLYAVLDYDAIADKIIDACMTQPSSDEPAAVEPPPAFKTIDGHPTKIGNGIEMTYEALVDILRLRFPNLISWGDYPLPSVILDEPRQVLTVYFRAIDTGRWPGDGGAIRSRRIGEGNPMPVILLRADSVSVFGGYSRCGWFSLDGAARQCEFSDLHPGPHSFLA